VTGTLVGASMLRVDDGRALPIDVRRWMAAADPVDHALLDRAEGPVLDVGCGPGRLVRALRHRGVHALGVDISPTAVALARRHGAKVLKQSIFDTVPGAGDWRSALLIDGSVGIGGDPAALLTRLAELLGPAGRVLVETVGSDAPSESVTVRIETARGEGPWFPWALVSIADIEQLGLDAGFRLQESWVDAGRWFACLEAGVSGARSAGKAGMAHR